MKTVWTKGKETEVAKDIRASYAGSVVMRKRLQEILLERIAAANKSSDDDYDSPSWAYRQADKAGFKRALSEIINILD